MRKDNRGFSIVELIIVIAIMSIMLGVMVYSFSLVTGKEASQCAHNIGTAMDKAKNYAMAKSGSSDVYLLIRKDGNKGYIAEYYIPDGPISTSYHMAEGRSEKLGKKAVEVKCTVGGSRVPLDDSNGIRIYYNRITGAFKDAEIVSNDNTSISDTGACTQIEVKRGKTIRLTLIQETGKYKLERIS